MLQSIIQVTQQVTQVTLNVINEVTAASQEDYDPDLEETQLKEDQDDCKLDFDLVTNEMREAAQEAISKQTITAYKG